MARGGLPIPASSHNLPCPPVLGRSFWGVLRHSGRAVRRWRFSLACGCKARYNPPPAATIAQLVERLVHTEEVSGSSPDGRTHPDARPHRRASVVLALQRRRASTPTTLDRTDGHRRPLPGTTLSRERALNAGSPGQSMAVARDRVARRHSRSSSTTDARRQGLPTRGTKLERPAREVRDPTCPSWDTPRCQLTPAAHLQNRSTGKVERGRGPSRSARDPHRALVLPIVPPFSHSRRIRRTGTWGRSVESLLRIPAARVSPNTTGSADLARFGARDLRKVPSFETDDLVEGPFNPGRSPSP